MKDVSTRLDDVSVRVTNLEWLDDAFYIDGSNNIHAKYSFVGDHEVAAYGVGSGSGSGGGSGSNIIVIDNLNAENDSDNALSARQGYVLKQLIDNLEITGTDSHTHANLSILNGINNTSISNWNTAYT